MTELHDVFVVSTLQRHNVAFDVPSDAGTATGMYAVLVDKSAGWWREARE